MPSATTQLRPESPAATANAGNGLVSVIVPIYNEVAHVEELLQAIEASPVQKEIIIVDDGSTDGTAGAGSFSPAACFKSPSGIVAGSGVNTGVAMRFFSL